MTKVSYHPGEDAVFIHVRDLPSARTEEVADNIMVDYSDDGQIVGYDIQDAKGKLDYISKLISTLPGPVTYIVHEARAEQVSELFHHSFG